MEKENIISSDLAILSIGTVATMLNVHQRTLRIYDKEGILCPQRTEKNRRCYSFDDIEKGKLIQFLTRNLALNLSGVKIILALLKKEKIDPQNYLPYIKEIAKSANISEEEQKINIEKSEKKGRKS